MLLRPLLTLPNPADPGCYSEKLATIKINKSACASQTTPAAFAAMV